MPSREIGWDIGTWWLIYVFAIVGITILGYLLFQRYRLWRLGKPDNRFDNLYQRIKTFITIGIVDGLLHRRFFRIGNGSGWRRFLPLEPLPGLIHILILGGALLLLIGAGADFLAHYEIFGVNFMEGNGYRIFSFLNDFGGVLIIIGLILAAVRRYIQKPDRLDNKSEDAIALGLVFILVISGYVLEGLRIAASNPGISWEKWGFVGYAFSTILPGSTGAYQAMWWIHLILTTVILIYICYYVSKLSHILVSPLNVFFRSLRPKGALVPIDLESTETFGVNRIEDFTWKQLLDLDACTRCGRCQDNCPAYLSGSPLSPKKVIQNLKTGLVSQWSPLSRPKAKKGRGEEAGKGDGNGNHEAPPIIGTLVTEDELWACTTCRACQEACPVFIEHIDKIVDMRRNLVLEQAKIPETTEGVLRCIETRGHSCRGTTFTRTDWTEGLEIKVLAEKSDVDILYWAGCVAALEDRNRKVAIAFAKLLQAAGVNFGILGDEETCCGEPARRIGNEYLFQMQAQRNIETLKNYNVRKIVTTCPHCFNTIKNEYPQFGGEFEVIHHTEFIAQLLKGGRLKLASSPVRLPTLNQKVTYQDSCYLGRYNDIYEPPREILREILGFKPVEMNRHHQSGLCCGGGGGHFWMEERVETRINEMRTEDVIKTGAGLVATACPYCLQMFEDGIKAKGKEESLKAMDLAELVILAISPDT